MGTQLLPHGKGKGTPHLSVHVYSGQMVAHLSNCLALVDEAVYPGCNEIAATKQVCWRGCCSAQCVQIAGIILDNYARGRTKHVWFSISSDLIVDARRWYQVLFCRYTLCKMQNCAKFWQFPALNRFLSYSFYLLYKSDDIRVFCQFCCVSIKHDYHLLACILISVMNSE